MGKIKVDLENPLAEGATPWDLMQTHEADHHGPEVFDPQQRMHWASAFLEGGLPYMWRKAYVVLDMIYGLCDLEDGARVLLIGQGLESCGFAEDLRRRIGPSGQLTAIDIQDDCRAALASGAKGRDGQRGTFRYDYCRDLPDNGFDAVLNLQAVRHADDWAEAGAELVRVLKPGCPLVMAEIVLGSPEQVFKVRQDLQLELLVDKIMSSLAMRLEEFPYHGAADLRRAFADQLVDMSEFEWRGLEAFSGRKPAV